MRTIIAGSRGISDYALVAKAVEASGFAVTVVISGTANGVDRLGEQYGTNHGIRVERFPANWDLHGKSAGYKRNVQMAEVADALIAVTNGSKGTGHMIDIANAKGLKVYVLDVRKEQNGD